MHKHRLGGQDFRGGKKTAASKPHGSCLQLKGVDCGALSVFAHGCMVCSYFGRKEFNARFFIIMFASGLNCPAEKQSQRDN